MTSGELQELRFKIRQGYLELSLADIRARNAAVWRQLPQLLNAIDSLDAQIAALTADNAALRKALESLLEKIGKEWFVLANPPEATIDRAAAALLPSPGADLIDRHRAEVSVLRDALALCRKMANEAQLGNPIDLIKISNVANDALEARVV